MVAVPQTADPPQISCYEIEAIVQMSLCRDLLQVGQAVHVCGQKVGHKFACEQRTDTMAEATGLAPLPGRLMVLHGLATPR